jgi:predicted DNA-binding transcriptional regulator
MHFPETDKIKYVPEKLDDLELEIRYKTVGISNVLSNEAVNELQVKGSFASMESILMRNKNELDILYKWAVDTVAKLLYRNIDIQIEANFGTEWYLISEEMLQKVFENAKKIGLPKAEQILIYEQLIDTKYKGNASKIARQKLLLRLDPFPLFSEQEAMDMFAKSVISSKELNLKINFYTFVSRFESENMVITEFGENLEEHKKIEIISKTLNIYNDENLKSKQSEPSGEGTEGD